MGSRAVAFCLFLLLLSPCVLANPPSPLQALSSSPDFTGFMRLLDLADVIPQIEDALRRGQALTVLAPSDDALVYHTSPTLLAALKHRDNKAALRQVLLRHFVLGHPSPFEWQGAHKTLAGDDLSLSMDAQAFYAQGTALAKFNALVSGGVTVHSLASLIVPASLSGGARLFIGEKAGIRRVLANAPAPAPATEIGGKVPSTSSPPNSAVAQRMASLMGLAATALLAICLI